MKTKVKSLSLAAFVIALLTQMASAQNVATVNFIVTKSYNGKPVRNAAVVIHPVNKNGKQGRGGIELKTDPDGKAHYDGLPFGKVRIQVIAESLQTFGEDIEINKETLEVTIKLDRPKAQYSIYEDHKKPDEKKPEDKKPDEKKPPSSTDPKSTTPGKEEKPASAPKTPGL
jgi:hypothetical protein